MLLTYVDESYGGDLYFVAGLLVPATETISLMVALDSVVSQAARTYPGLLESEAELHGHDMVAGKKDWRALAPMVRVRIGVYDAALQAIARHDVKVIVRGVHVGRLRARYSSPQHPHSVCLAHLIERVDEYAEKTGELALMIADEVQGQAGHREDLWRYQRLWTPGYRGHRIKRIVDTIHFAPSHASRLVQAADLVAYIVRRRQHPETDQRAAQANALLWSRIKPKVQHQGCWYP